MNRNDRPDSEDTSAPRRTFDGKLISELLRILPYVAALPRHPQSEPADERDPDDPRSIREQLEDTMRRHNRPWSPAPDTPDGQRGALTLDPAIDELIREYDQSRSSSFDVPAGWTALWWWAAVFGVEDAMDTYLDERRRSIRIDSPLERPGLRDAGGAPDLGADRPERLYAIVNYFERVDPQVAVGAAYRTPRDIAMQLQYGQRFEGLQRWLGDSPPSWIGEIDDAEPPEPEFGDALNEQLDQFVKGDTALGDLPAAWLSMWQWAHVFGLQDRFAGYLDDRRRVLGVPLFPRPTEEQMFGPADRPERLSAIINFYEEILEADPTPTTRALRDFTVGSLAEMQARLYEDLELLTRPLDQAPPERPVVAPPTMELDQPAAEDDDDPLSSDRRKDEHDDDDDDSDHYDDDDDESGAVQVNPVRLELDPDPREGLDSAVDDSDGGRVVLDRPVGARRPPRPLGAGQWTGPRAPGSPSSPPAPTSASESASGPGTGSGDEESPGEPRVSMTKTDVERAAAAASHRDMLEQSLAEPQEEIDSAVDDSEPTGTPGRGLEVPPYRRNSDAKPETLPGDSGVDDSDPVTPLADSGGSLGSDTGQVVIEVAHVGVDDQFNKEIGVDHDMEVAGPGGDSPAVVATASGAQASDDMPSGFGVDLDLAATKPAVVSSRPNLGRIGALAAVLVLVVIAALIALTRGGDDATEAVVGDPGSAAASPTAAAAAPDGPTEAATEDPGFQIAPVASLVICASNPEASFSGFLQPDGTYLDADTGEPRGCPTD